MAAHDAAADLCRVYQSLNPAVVLAVAQELTDRTSGALDEQRLHRVLQELTGTSGSSNGPSVPWLDATRHLVRPPAARGAARGASRPSAPVGSPAAPPSLPGSAPHAGELTGAASVEGGEEWRDGTQQHAGAAAASPTAEDAPPDVAALQQRFSTMDPSVVQDVCRGARSHAHAAERLQAIAGGGALEVRSADDCPLSKLRRAAIRYALGPVEMPAAAGTPRPIWHFTSCRLQPVGDALGLAEPAAGMQSCAS